MKANAIIECVLCIDSLKTIGIFLLQEGMYQIRVNMYMQHTVKIPIAAKENVLLKKKEVQYLPAHIIDSFYMSDAFLLRQWTEEEKFDIKNGCRFSASVPYECKDFPIVLEVELMFYDLASKIVTFESVSMAKFKIESACQGVYEYIPVILGDDHFTLINMSLYISLVDFQFKMPTGTEVRNISQAESQLNQIRIMFTKIMDPLKTALKGMQMFVQNMELDTERLSSSGGMNYLRQSRSLQLPFSNTESIMKGETSVQNLSKLMANEYKSIRTQLQQVWQRLVSGVKQQHHRIIRQLKRESLLSNQVRFSAFTTREVIPVVDHTYTMTLPSQKQNQEQLDIKNKRNEYLKLLQGPSKILDSKIIDEIKDKLVIVERHYQTRPHFPISRAKLHLVVFVHGYQGHSYDMRMLENYMCLRFPNHMLLVSLANQHNTEGDILQMGINLSEEIKGYITAWSFTYQLVISFIAHSLGGLIVRAALPYLDYEFHTLMTLGSPHLGYITNNHTLIQFGLWFLQKIKKSQCLHQLNCKDDTLIKLAKFHGMNKFKNLIFFGSEQDHYVASESCLLLKVNQDSVHNEMATLMLRQLNQNEILRITVDYKFYDGDFDTFLGRKAHIAILESHFLNQYIIYNLGDYFR